MKRASLNSYNELILCGKLAVDIRVRYFQLLHVCSMSVGITVPIAHLNKNFLCNTRIECMHASHRRKHIVPTYSAVRQGPRRGRGRGASAPHFYGNFKELLRKRCFQPPHFESLFSPLIFKVAPRALLALFDKAFG